MKFSFIAMSRSITESNNIKVQFYQNEKTKMKLKAKEGIKTKLQLKAEK